MEHRELPASTNARFRSQVAFDNVFNTTGRPVQAHMRPVVRAGQNHNDVSILRSYATRFRTEVNQILRTYLPTWRPGERLDVTGELYMSNWTNQGHAAIRTITVREITADLFIEMFENATTTGSNPDLSIYDVDWKFYFDADSLQRGGMSFAFKNTKKFDGILNWDTKLIASNGTYHTDIGCLTLALARGLHSIIKNEEFIRNKKKSIFNSKLFTEFCKALQDQLKLDKICPVQDVEKFTLFYPDYRVVVITDMWTKPEIFEGVDYSRDSDHKKDKTIFIYHDGGSEHFVFITGIVAFLISLRGGNKATKFCYSCCTVYNSKVASSTCACSESKGTVPIRKFFECECGEKIRKGDKHLCGHKSCHFCQQIYKDQANHRCPIYIDPKSLERVFKGDVENDFGHKDDVKEDAKEDDRPQPEAWVWDIESHFVIIEDEETDYYKVDKNGHFTLDENNDVKVSRVKRLAQLPNYVYCRNLFSGEQRAFTDIESFIRFAVVEQNDGHNYFYAHNSSGYDSRLIYEAAEKMMIVPPEAIMRGSRFMKLKFAQLAKSFKLDLKKGYFPHLFSTLENLDYVGIIPDKEYFDLTFHCKSEDEFKEFNNWWKEWYDSKRIWSYQEQRALYCKNDVDILAEIWLKYHQGSILLYKSYPYITFSPWFSITIASYVHKCQIRHLHEGHNIGKMTTEELEAYTKTTWCGLEPEEQYYTRLALRGGMTNICKYIHEGEFSYVDIQSSYPSVQMDVENMYPVGAPTIEIHDVDYYPCRKCTLDPLDCPHTFLEKQIQRNRLKNDKLDIKLVNPPDLHTYCLNFFGIITVDITPPRNLYHPLIQVFDEKLKKVIGSLDTIKKETIPSVMVVEAIKIGYKVTKIYRADRYTASESKWRNGLAGDTYLAKMRCAGKVPLEDQARQKQLYKDKFKIDIPSFDDFEDNDVGKLIAKLLSNTAWGKHAESTDHAKTKIVSIEGTEGQDFYKSVKENGHKIMNIHCTGTRTFFAFKENRLNTKPDLHRGYLPVAVFVTAYGRLKLWRELVKIDPPGTRVENLRVLMYDTDSVVYSVPTKESSYVVPSGDILGDWEIEKIQKQHAPLLKFYSIGPKSYSIICEDGYISMKLKGARLAHAHQNLMYPEKMKELVLAKKPDSEAKTKVAILPQSSFDYRLNKGDTAMTVRKFRKVIQFNETDVKGTFNWNDYRGYPIGFQT